LRAKDGQFVLRRRERYPAGEISLRSASHSSFAIVDCASGELLGTTEAARAFSTLHPGAIYLHLGRSFHVRELGPRDGNGRSSNRSTRTGTPSQRETDTQIERLSTAARRSE